MRGSVRRLCQALLLAVGLCALPGCFGGSQNPSYFPFLCPTGDIIRTHAKPPGFGYYANFDPHAVRLEVRPNAIVTNPVRTQHVVIATIFDENNVPRRDRRVEWMVEGVGNILEVDESGLLPGRGYKVDNKYAVSYTNYNEHHITRGNTNPGDDFVLRPGQTWCLISSAVEGDTHITVYAPGIFDWQKSKQVVTLRWVDAGWVFPPPSVATAGSEQVLTTRVFRASEQQPLAGYRVRYKLLDGPPARFEQSNRDEVMTTSNLNGHATARLVQVTPQAGINRIGIEVVRPPDPTSPSGVGVVLANGETTVEWIAPAIGLTHTGPPTAAVGQENLTFNLAVTNSGKVEASFMTVTNPIPPGLQYQRSNPPAVVKDGNLIWTFGKLPPGQVHTIQTVFKALSLGTVNNCARVVTAERISVEKCAVTIIGQPGLKVGLSAPPTATVDVPVDYQITLTNPGTIATDKILVVVRFDPGLEHSLGKNPLAKEASLEVDPLGPGETRTLRPLQLIPRVAGKLVTKVTATAAGGLSDRAEHVLLAQRPQLNLRIDGPKKQFVSQTAPWRVTVNNPGPMAMNNLVVRYQLPPEMAFQGSDPPGVPDNGEVVWKLATVPAQGQTVLSLSLRGEKVSAAAVHRVSLLGEPNLNLTAQTSVQLSGVPALQLKMIDLNDPVQVGKRITYQIDVTNTGSLDAAEVAIKATLPPELTAVAQKTQGPTAATIAGQNVTFAPLAALPPQQTTRYTIEALAKKAGDVRVRVELNSKALDGPVIEEESSQIYEVGNGATATPGPPTVAPGLPQPWIVPRPLPAGPKTQ